MDFRDEKADQHQRFVFARVYCEGNPLWETIFQYREKFDHPTMLKIVRRRMISERIPYVLDAYYAKCGQHRRPSYLGEAADRMYATLRFCRML